MTADAVRGIGDGNIEKGAQRLYDQMKKRRKEQYNGRSTQKQEYVPPEFIEAAGKTYLGDLADSSLVVIIKLLIFQKHLVHNLQLDKILYKHKHKLQLLKVLVLIKPFLNQAQAAQTQAGVLAGQAGQFVGPQAYQQFMSPYQQDVINDTLMAEFDVQAAEKECTSVAGQSS